MDTDRTGPHVPPEPVSRVHALALSAVEASLARSQPEPGEGDAVRGRWARMSTGRPSESRLFIVHWAGSISICPTGHPSLRMRARTSHICAWVATPIPHPPLPRGARSVIGAVAVSTHIRWSLPPTSMTAPRGGGWGRSLLECEHRSEHLRVVDHEQVEVGRGRSCARRTASCPCVNCGQERAACRRSPCSVHRARRRVLRGTLNQAGVPGTASAMGEAGFGFASKSYSRT